MVLSVRGNNALDSNIADQLVSDRQRSEIPPVMLTFRDVDEMILRTLQFQKSMASKTTTSTV
jgi:hypothetical protein